MVPATALLDTSVLLRLFHDEADRDQPAVDALRAAWAAGEIDLLVLDLSVYELVSVLVRRLGFEAQPAQAVVDALFEMELPLVGVDRGLARETVRVAADTGLSGYDAAFVAAARDVGVPLLTADRRIVEKAPTVARPLRSIIE